MIPGVSEFAAPWYLLLMPVLALIALSWQYWQNSKPDGKKPPERLLSPVSSLRARHPLLYLLQSRQDKTRRHARLDSVMLWLVIGLLVLAMAEPVKVGSRVPESPAQRDITFIVDTSVSMLLRDYVIDGERIDRMSFLKSFLDQFVQGLEGDRISIIVFGESAYTFIPLTDDQYLIRRMLSRIETTMAGRFNALGEAISLAVRQSEDNSARKRVLVLLTDADKSTDSISPLAAAELANNAGLPLYTIAIGAENYSAAEDAVSDLVYHPADTRLLEKLASITSAKSYLAGDDRALRRAVDDINQREAYSREIPPRYYRLPLYPYPLISALLLLIIYQLMHILSSILRNRWPS